MSSAFQPEKASGQTGAAVRSPRPLTVQNSTLEGKTPLSSYGHGPQPTGNPHTNSGPNAFAKPMHNYSGGMQGAAVTHETRGGTGGIPHVNMHPSGKGMM